MTAAEMLAGCFASITSEGDRRVDACTKAFARSIDDVAQALEDGLNSKDVAIVCRHAARALRDPKQLKKIQKEAGEEVKRRHEEA